MSDEPNWNEYNRGYNDAWQNAQNAQEAARADDLFNSVNRELAGGMGREAGKAGAGLLQLFGYLLVAMCAVLAGASALVAALLVMAATRLLARDAVVPYKTALKASFYGILAYLGVTLGVLIVVSVLLRLGGPGGGLLAGASAWEMASRVAIFQIPGLLVCARLLARRIGAPYAGFSGYLKATAVSLVAVPISIAAAAAVISTVVEFPIGPQFAHSSHTAQSARAAPAAAAPAARLAPAPRRLEGSLARFAGLAPEEFEVLGVRLGGSKLQAVRRSVLSHGVTIVEEGTTSLPKFTAEPVPFLATTGEGDYGVPGLRRVGYFFFGDVLQQIIVEGTAGSDSLKAHARRLAEFTGRFRREGAGGAPILHGPGVCAILYSSATGWNERYWSPQVLSGASRGICF